MHRATVIGGSVAGLCAARVLADHFDRVTVLDRDVLPREATHRKGAPQSRHPHALLDRGRAELERLFPGFDRLLIERGALEIDPGLELAVLFPNAWGRRRATPRRLLFASRILIESTIRDLAGELSGLEVLERSEVTGIRLDGHRVRGIRVRSRETGTESDLDSDLVVDTSGYGSKVPGWLEGEGLPRVEQEVANGNAGYSSCWFQAPAAQASEWWKAVWLNPLTPGSAKREEDLYYGVIFPVENDRWIVTVASWGGRPLPRDHESFVDLLGRLRSPLIAEAISRAEPISPVYRRRGMLNHWNHYERWRGDLTGFLALGDAACTFNPVYGQGMSTAAVCAQLLGQALGHESFDQPSFAPRFFRRQAAFLGDPWSLAVERDRRAVGHAGDSSSRLRQVAADVFGRILDDGIDDPAIGEAFFDVFNLNRTPTSLLVDPGFLARIGWVAVSTTLSQWTAQRPLAPPAYPSPTIIS